MEGFEEIRLCEIRKGDFIRMVRKDGTRTFVYEGAALEWDQQQRWWKMQGTWSASNDEYPNYNRTFYRRRFVFPTSWGSVIMGNFVPGGNDESYALDRVLGSGASKFMLCQTGMWRSEKGSGLSASEIAGNFNGLTVLRDGI